MRIVEVLRANRIVHVVGLLGLLALAGGCGGGGSTDAPVVASPDLKQKQEAEREARHKAFGDKSTIPTKQAPK